MTEVTTKMSIGSWDEVGSFAAPAPQKHARVAAKKAYTGALQGEGVLDYLLCYTNDESAHYVGYERITGEWEGKAGSFVMKLEGTYGDGAAKERGELVAGAGTGAFVGLRGEMRYQATHGEQTHDVHFQLHWVEAD